MASFNFEPVISLLASAKNENACSRKLPSEDTERSQRERKIELFKDGLQFAQIIVLVHNELSWYFGLPVPLRILGYRSPAEMGGSEDLREVGRRLARREPAVRPAVLALHAVAARGLRRRKCGTRSAAEKVGQPRGREIETQLRT